MTIGGYLSRLGADRQCQQQRLRRQRPRLVSQSNDGNLNHLGAAEAANGNASGKQAQQQQRSQKAKVRQKPPVTTSQIDSSGNGGDLSRLGGA